MTKNQKSTLSELRKESAERSIAANKASAEREKQEGYTPPTYAPMPDDTFNKFAKMLKQMVTAE